MALGTNPWTFAAPASGGDSLVLDMATTAVALGKVSFILLAVVGWEKPLGVGEAAKPEFVVMGFEVLKM